MADTATDNYEFVLPEPNGSDDSWGLKLNDNWIALDTLLDIIQNAIPDAVPSGAVSAFAMETAPSGWLSADGTAVSRATYANLFSAIGTTYGAGDGTTTFNLPDLRGEFIRGFDDGRGVDSGRTFGSTQADEFKSHNHDMYVDVTSTGDRLTISDTAGTDEGGLASTRGKAWMLNSGGTETRPRNIAMNYCIKT